MMNPFQIVGEPQIVLPSLEIATGILWLCIGAGSALVYPELLVKNYAQCHVMGGQDSAGSINIWIAVLCILHGIRLPILLE